MNSSNTKMTAVVVAVVALVVGMGGGYLIGHKKNDTKVASNSTAPATDTKAADLRVVLNNLEETHVSLAAAATRAGFDGARNFDAAAAQLDVNSHSIADAIGSVYGKDAGDKFYQIWNSHIGFFVNYTVAAKKGDQAGMAQAVSDLNGYVDAVSTFLSGANPNLPKDAVKQLVTEHVGLLKGAVDKYGANDLTGSYADEQKARDQISTIASTIAGAIVKQKPELF